MLLYEQIRRAHKDGNTSIRGLARRYGVHRRDVRAALASPIPPPRKPGPPVKAPKLDPWKPLIEEWLKDDLEAPEKQCHTGRRVWERLVTEHDADVGSSTVRAYVKKVRDAQRSPISDVAVPQHHPLGEEAEVDFGEASVWLAGVLVKVHLFVMRLSASGKSFTWAYTTETQEVFLDGHVRAFNHFGGVPGRVRYDNLKAAVVRVLRGRNRIETDRFIALRSHYGFESFFCRPGIEGAHEKGGVEGEVGRFRRGHLVPVPRVGSMIELNQLILVGCGLDDGRLIGHRRISVGEHFETEAEQLRSLPVEPFDAAYWSTRRADTKARISVGNVSYSVPAGLARQPVDVRIGADTIEVSDRGTIVACHPRGRKGNQVLSLDHYLEVLATKPGAMPGAIPLKTARDSGVFTNTHETFWNTARRQLGDSGGTRVMIDVLLHHRRLPGDAVVAGMTAALAVGSVDPGVVLIEARRSAEGRAAPVIPIGAHISIDRPTPTTSGYDALLAGAS